MDNASVHTAEGVEEAIEAKGAILFYLPAYSPDFNPIEHCLPSSSPCFVRLPHILSSKRRTPSIVYARPTRL